MGKKHERRDLRIEDAEGNLFDAVWSRSGKHLIVTVAPRGDWDRAGQIELSPEQLASVRQFIDETIATPSREH
jgi:hypothetical protein